MQPLPFLSNHREKSFQGKRVLLRIDANVPITSGALDEHDAFRLRSILPTIKFLLAHKARVVMISHHGGEKNTQTLSPVAEYFNRALDIQCGFVPEITGDVVMNVITHLPEGGVTLLENLRTNPGEETNDGEFAKTLASYCDIYINDAFSASHRKHASIVGVAELVSSKYLGLQFENELYNLEPLIGTPDGAVVIIGGSKFDTKLDIIKHFINKNVTVFVVGALAHPFYKAMGYEIGKSLCDTSVDISDITKHPLIRVPQYVTVLNDSGTRECLPASRVGLQDTIVDIATDETSGQKTMDQIKTLLGEAKTILWNGPLGWYEKGYTKGTLMCAESITSHGGFSILGGGDTVSVVSNSKFLERFGFVSTGGGALLEYLLNGTLPGIEVIKK